MYLFDKSRHGRQNFRAFTSKPSIKWKTDLRTNPIFGAESTATIDKYGNLYFGSHSGNFYSISNIGEIRWTFSTSTKIYSSPLLIEDNIFFSGGDGFFYCLDLLGNLKWKFDLTKASGGMFKKKTLNKLLHLPYTYDFYKKRNIDYKSWSSPNFNNGKLFITGYGKGLYCLNIEGSVLWSFDLGYPRYQLSGVAIDNAGNIYCSSRSGKIYSFEDGGKLRWERTIKKNWENWGNPVVCNLKNQAYFFFSKKEISGLIQATDFLGNLKWTINIGSIRGACSISWDGEFIFCCDLDGFIYKINSSDGQIVKRKKITDAQRGLWITPTIDENSNILLSTKDSQNSGRVILMDDNFEFKWEYYSNKILSIPVLNSSNEIYFGSWDGSYYCIY
ncbi:PQQ-binding-like beta-propeller repeat protein [Aquiflexum sp. LQ15W]|uniref:outer membrane protein assembly factor BamB family protein n=1 Tax=Cognataquiflexum nitidum TaxID=2922272 RepID=UPI001F1308B8|nr:PQQ-binding-like beta-propeller repeat protein [Cognataquiflexum nitidum]MCH6202190.1 PQQ-binding-like beta-propeller repeat protein [Cognataquiflexum nitidum]